MRTNADCQSVCPVGPGLSGEPLPSSMTPCGMAPEMADAIVEGIKSEDPGGGQGL